LIKFKERFNKKKDYKYLKNKNYFYYTYWYPFYLKRLEKRTFYYDAIKLLNLEELNPVRMNGLGRAIKTYYHFQPFLKKKAGSNFFKTHYSNMLLYYAYNAGFNQSTNAGKQFINIDEYNILVVDIRFAKPRIFCVDEKKCVGTLTSGIITKILGVKEKNLKKSSRVLNVMVKTALKKLKEKTFKTKNMVFIRGVKNYVFNLISILNENIDGNNFILFFNPTIRKNKIRFKKIRSIKRNLRKKFLRFENSKN
jgi:hypothetical protein